jgi:hypothetical protein
MSDTHQSSALLYILTQKYQQYCKEVNDDNHLNLLNNDTFYTRKLYTHNIFEDPKQLHQKYSLMLTANHVPMIHNYEDKRNRYNRVHASHLKTPGIKY